MDNSNRLFVIMGIFLAIFLGVSFYFDSTKNASTSDSDAPAQEQSVAKPSTDLENQSAKDVSAVSLPEPNEAAVTRDDISVDTPLYTAVFSEKGGRLKSFKLKKYNQRKLNAKLKDELMELVTMPDRNDWPMRLSFTDASAPDLENAPYFADKANLKLAEGETGELTLTFTSPDGLIVRRTFSFSADSYLAKQKITMENHGNVSLDGRLTMRLNSAPFSITPGRYDLTAAYVDGKLISADAKKARKEFDKFRGSAKQVDWAGYMDQYFLTALVMPDSSEAVDEVTPSITAVLQDHGGIAVGASRLVSLAPGKKAVLDFDFYYGPKSNADLKSAGHNLDKSVDLGWFSFLANPLASLLRWVNSWCGNYGLAIILVTVMIKIVLWPLVIKSYRSMKEMQTLQPMVTKIRERHADDKEAMNREIMQLYKTFKVNPLGGCLPMLLQIPFFIAFYRVLDSLLELRGAPFIGWIQDLAAPDRLFSFNFTIPFFDPPTGIPVLTILMGASMVLQQRMMPNTMGDPTQAKIMMLMPLIFTFILINMPAGLVLYWLVNNVLSIGQQLIVNRPSKKPAA